MTANHDTPEAVEAMAAVFGAAVSGDGETASQLRRAAAMLRRLHQRAVDAERERDEAQDDRDSHQRAAIFAMQSRATETAQLRASLDTAERERDQWIANSRENKLIAESNLRERDARQRDAEYWEQECMRTFAALVTARADALREAAATRAQTDTSFEMYCAILALINKEPSDA